MILDIFQNLIHSTSMYDDPADLLRRHGVQATAQRLAVLAAVSSQPHSTADDVAKVVRAEIGVISRQAVYDALGVLADKGLIRRIQPAGSPARYEGRTGDNHHHLICRLCGRTVDVDCAVGAAPCLTPAEDSGFEIDEAEVVYWGRCPECLAQHRDPSRTEGKPVPVSDVAQRNDDSDTDRATAHDQTEQP
jgi:Fe2+ or Zn2+ uptake regulation protein